MPTARRFASWQSDLAHNRRSSSAKRRARRYGHESQRELRGTDASDATLEVLTHQLSVFETPADDEKTIVQLIDTDTDPQMLQALRGDCGDPRAMKLSYVNRRS